MVVVRFGEDCKVLLDEKVKDVRITDGRTAIVKLVFDEEWKIREVLVNDMYVWKRGSEDV